VDCSKGPDSDKQAFASFVRELSAVMKPKGLLLSAAVSPSKMVIDAGYDVSTLAKHLEWIGVMTYDYHGQWDKKTGHVAPLYHHPNDDNTYFNAVSLILSINTYTHHITPVSLATNITHGFCFISYLQISHACSPVPISIDLGFLYD
jgi:GH18 family chitinase